MRHEYVINAQLREATGTGESRRIRHAGQVPAVMYGADKDNVYLTLNSDELSHNLSDEAFHNSLLTIDTGKTRDTVILRDVQMHPYKPRVLHVDFQRVRATEKLHMQVPLHFVGGEDCPGVRLNAGILSHLINEVDIACLPKDLPEYLELDVSGLDLNDSLHLSDIKLPEGVEITSLAHGGEDLAVAMVAPPRVEVEEEPEEAEEEEGLEAGEEAEEEGDSDDESED